MTYTRRAFSVALAAASMTFGLLLGHADAQQTATAQPAQFAAQLVPGQSYTITVPDGVECLQNGEMGPCPQYPSKTFTATYEGPCPNLPSQTCWYWSHPGYRHEWGGIIPLDWVD